MEEILAEGIRMKAHGRLALEDDEHRVHAANELVLELLWALLPLTLQRDDALVVRCDRLLRVAERRCHDVGDGRHGLCGLIFGLLLGGTLE